QEMSLVTPLNRASRSRGHSPKEVMGMMRTKPPTFLSQRHQDNEITARLVLAATATDAGACSGAVGNAGAAMLTTSWSVHDKVAIQRRPTPRADTELVCDLPGHKGHQTWQLKPSREGAPCRACKTTSRRRCATTPGAARGSAAAALPR